jgi:hypothetical protein
MCGWGGLICSRSTVGMNFCCFNRFFLPFFFFLTVAVGEVVVMGKDWLAREVCGGEKL